MKYKIENSYGEPIKVYSDYDLEDVKTYLGDICLYLKDFGVDRKQDYSYFSNDWVEDYFNFYFMDEIEDIEDFYKKDNKGNRKYDIEEIYREIFYKVLNFYETTQEESIDNAWEFYTAHFSEKEFEMLLCKLAKEYETELEKDEDFDILEPFFKLDNAELIEVLELEYSEFLCFESFKGLDMEELNYHTSFEDWLKNLDFSDYLNWEYKEDEEEEEE